MHTIARLVVFALMIAFVACGSPAPVDNAQVDAARGRSATAQAAEKTTGDKLIEEKRAGFRKRLKENAGPTGTGLLAELGATFACDEHDRLGQLRTLKYDVERESISDSVLVAELDQALTSTGKSAGAAAYKAMKAGQLSDCDNDPFTMFDHFVDVMDEFGPPTAEKYDPQVIRAAFVSLANSHLTKAISEFNAGEGGESGGRLGEIIRGSAKYGVRINVPAEVMKKWNEERGRG